MAIFSSGISFLRTSISGPISGSSPNCKWPGRGAHPGFVDWNAKPGGHSHTTVRVGRQEVGFGSGRLIAPAEGLNLRRSAGARKANGIKSEPENDALVGLRIVWSLLRTGIDITKIC
jgi:hypothetical protein